MFDILR